MEILVTGRNGQLGKSIRKVVSSATQNHNFVFIGREELDLNDNVNISRYFDSHNFDAIINCAGYTFVDKAEENLELNNQINHLAVKQIAQQKNIKLIHISTDYVFNGSGSIAYTESDLPNPINAYGKVKLLGEQAIQRAMDNNAIIIRTSGVYSEYGSNFVSTMLSVAQSKNELEVVSDQIVSTTYAQDLAKTIIHIVNSQYFAQEQFATDIYHYSNIGQCSWCEFAKAIFSMKNISCSVSPITTKQYPTIAKRPIYTALNQDKIVSTFNIKIPKWQSSLKDCLKKI